MAISTVSFNKTPQAGNDSFSTSEDSSLVLNLDVMANDLGGNAKKLYSLDDGNVASDLLTTDVVGAVQYSAAGAAISITADGKVHYDASALAPGLQSLAQGEIFQDSFTYAIQLGNGTLSWATATIQIVGTNDGPVARVDTNSGSEDTLITGSVATNDSDVDHGAVLSYALGAPVEGLTFNADGSYSFDAGNAAYQHLAQGATLDVVANYTVTDEHGASASSTLTITLLGTNDGPIALPDTNSGTEDSSITGSVAGNDSDVDDGAVLGYSLDAPVAGLTLNSDGSYSLDAGDPAYQHLAEGATQTVVAGYTVTDEHGASAGSTLSIKLEGANDAPEALADTNAGNEDAVITGSVAGNDSDADDGAVLTFSLDTSVTGLAFGATGEYSLDGADAAYQHLAQGATLDLVAGYTVTDEHGASASSTLTITLTGVNDGPVALADTNSGAEDTLITGSVAGNDSDVDDGAVLTYMLDGPVAGLILNADGGYSFNAGDAAYQSLNSGQYLDVTAHYTVTDEWGASSASTLTLTIAGASDEVVATLPPVFTGGGDLFDLPGPAGNDSLVGGNQSQSLSGGAGNDTLVGGNSGDFLFGGTGNDVLSGVNGADALAGGSGNDSLSGGNGPDTLVGGFGADTIAGGDAGDDISYVDLRDTGDQINGFVSGSDQFDLSLIDADSSIDGDQAFAWAGEQTGPYVEANSVSWYQSGANAVVLADTNGDLTNAEFSITVSNVTDLQESDFLL